MHGATVKKEEKLFTIGHGVIFQDSFILSNTALVSLALVLFCAMVYLYE